MIFKKNLKIIIFLILAITVIAGQSLLSKAYEAHVINVTAHICRQTETRTPGYWKTHEEITMQLLPQTLGTGTEEVLTFEQAFDILDSNAQDMRNKLMSHLLAMKFNIAYYGVGEYEYYVESQGRYMTINEIVGWADSLLSLDNPPASRDELEEVKDILDYLNNLHELRACATITQIPVQTFQFMEEEVVVTERVAVPSCEAESQQPCFTSLAGICAVGIQTCTADGNWDECVQSNQPIDEICDNQLDDNCDGLTDCDDEFCTEDLSCQAEPTTECELDATQSCSTGQPGVCAAGTQTCNTDGLWGECIADNEPATEICDDELDNDCDEYTDCDDEDCAEDENCQEGPTPECEPEATTICSTSLPGICAAGTQTCDENGFWGECIQDEQPVEEICDDGLDNNCDDLTDCDDPSCVENPSCQPPVPQPECTADETQPCETGQLGICAAGTKTCSAEGFWGECIQTNQPVDEICNNALDDNCDGNIDCGDSSCLEDESCLPPAEQ